MGMELGKVKGALQRKIQQTGQPFLTTESLLEAILGRDPEYESDPDDDDYEEDREYEDEDEDEIMSGLPRPRIRRRSVPSSMNNNGATNGLRRSSIPAVPSTGIQEVTSSSSQGVTSSSSSEEHSSGDEEGRGSPATSSGIGSGPSGLNSGVNSHSESEEEANMATKVPAARSASGDSGISDAAMDDNANGKKLCREFVLANA